jgi:hypothetical protein
MNLTLNRAADIIEQTGWTQGAFAIDAAGNPVTALSPTATCYCTIGAIRKAAGGHTRVIARANAALCEHLGIRDTADWNDTAGRTREEVVAALRGAA